MKLLYAISHAAAFLLQMKKEWVALRFSGNYNINYESTIAKGIMYANSVPNNCPLCTVL